MELSVRERTKILRFIWIIFVTFIICFVSVSSIVFSLTICLNKVSGRTRKLMYEINLSLESNYMQSSNFKYNATFYIDIFDSKHGS